MNRLSQHTKRELINALNGESSVAFVLDGKLISVEMDETSSQNDLAIDDLSREIEEYPELKESLSRYLTNPEMKRYTSRELKAKRYEKRK
ncbi:hypothetical protein [Oceanobacillus profundus]|uniref:hypothetical protein n=1 Tax=Oceanobacillus profundus TaxID=372463 RepID=UPI003640A60B|nr:hypothetical protein [Oceanobacillus sp.]